MSDGAAPQFIPWLSPTGVPGPGSNFPSPQVSPSGFVPMLPVDPVFGPATPASSIFSGYTPSALLQPFFNQVIAADGTYAPFTYAGTPAIVGSGTLYPFDPIPLDQVLYYWYRAQKGTLQAALDINGGSSAIGGYSLGGPALPWAEYGVSGAGATPTRCFGFPVMLPPSQMPPNPLPSPSPWQLTPTLLERASPNVNPGPGIYPPSDTSAMTMSKTVEDVVSGSQVVATAGMGGNPSTTIIGYTGPGATGPIFFTAPRFNIALVLFPHGAPVLRDPDSGLFYLPAALMGDATGTGIYGLGAGGAFISSMNPQPYDFTNTDGTIIDPITGQPTVSTLINAWTLSDATLSLDGMEADLYVNSAGGVIADGTLAYTTSALNIGTGLPFGS